MANICQKVRNNSKFNVFENYDIVFFFQIVTDTVRDKIKKIKT